MKKTPRKPRIFKKLKTKFIFSFCVFALAILSSTCALGYYEYKTNVENLYNENAYNVAHQAAALLDGDLLEQYAATPVIDDNYLAMKQKLETLRSNMDVVSIYVAKIDVPSDGNYFYLIDTLENHDIEFTLGDVMDYPVAETDIIKDVYYHGKDMSSKKIYIHSQTYGDNFFALVPVYNSRGTIVANVFVQCSIEQINQTLQTYLIYAVSIAVGIMIVILFLFLIYLNSNVISPIKKITEHASHFASSGSELLSSTLEKIHTGDEIETLYDSIIKMEYDIHNYVDNLAAATATREHMTAELNIAQQIQKNLFPYQFPAFPERNDFDIYANIRSCPNIGGCFYNFFLINENNLCFFIGDVNGNGIPTSMFSVITATLIKNFCTKHTSPGRVLAQTNNELSQNNNAELTASVFLGIVNLSTGTLTYSTAGDMCVLLKSSDSNFEAITPKESFALASMEQVHYSEHSLQLSQSDLLFLCTKGITEAVDEKGTIFGSEYTQQTIENLVNREYSVKTLTDCFYQSIDEFCHETVQSRDSAILLFRYIGD